MFCERVASDYIGRGKNHRDKRKGLASSARSRPGLLAGRWRSRVSAGNHQLWLFSAMISKMVRSVPAMPACLSPHRAAGRITLRAGNHLGHDRAHWTTAHSGQSSWTFSWTCSVPAPPRGTYGIKREAAASSLAPARVVCYNYSALIRNAPNRKTVEGD